MQLSKKIISLTFDGINQDEIQRIRDIIQVLLKNHVFEIRRGTAELSFDHESRLRDITFHTKVYKSDQPDVPSVKIFESVKMEIVGLPQTIRSDFSNEWTPDEKAMMRK
mgnify:CR=1 FL=1